MTKRFLLLFLFSFVFFFSMPTMTKAQGPFLTTTSGFQVSLFSPINNGQSAESVFIAGTYNSASLPAGYSVVCMIPYLDANTWNEGGGKSFKRGYWSQSYCPRVLV